MQQQKLMAQMPEALHWGLPLAALDPPLPGLL